MDGNGLGDDRGATNGQIGAVARIARSRNMLSVDAHHPMEQHAILVRVEHDTPGDRRALRRP
jgi:hypothetical protein